MKRVGLIGYPVAHSVSPLIQNVAFAHHHREERYALWETPPSELEARVHSLRSPDALGANVTVPHKQAVIPFLDRLDAVASDTGAVNTIVNQGGWLSGYNTDVVGFQRALESTGFSATGQPVAVLGAGGAARAVGLALVRAGVASLDLCDVDVARAKALAGHLRSLAPASVIVRAHLPSDSAFREEVTEARLLVNCTPVGTRHGEAEGQTPLDPVDIPSGALVFDLVYNPPLTPLLVAAQTRGARTANGLSMLVHQAAASFKLWTGLDAPVDEMLAAAEAGLSETN
ncbi:MAG: shikimate dehydrogenase [Dehalococcoidia bacterium]|jgi:shikimate dehydrogenase